DAVGLTCLAEILAGEAGRDQISPRQSPQPAHVQLKTNLREPRLKDYAGGGGDLAERDDVVPGTAKPFLNPPDSGKKPAHGEGLTAQRGAVARLECGVVCHLSGFLESDPDRSLS